MTEQYEIKGIYNGQELHEVSYDANYIINLWHVLKDDAAFRGTLGTVGHVAYCFINW